MPVYYFMPFFRKYLASFEANGVSVTVHECSLLKSFSTSLTIAKLYVVICPYHEEQYFPWGHRRSLINLQYAQTIIEYQKIRT
ncbi:hypothetical protein ES319_D07G186000v1 [Gossypium barbadense]|uniref:Uncharacterized protein n=3 Tax=Gossypium TaxID=3633 RepID=A0A5J5QV03_GOSBA|nr:hypothetical protein ES319_D07G186000v1 [Gossypium barbadense]TYG62097.1 hypothetical protein ES288_D07G200500v1 [Gossypium darwinii]TYH63494.1 hypothetical protein ES332_D07G196700v1 [Gossypium tomentosum]